jgi:hypothetical protein
MPNPMKQYFRRIVKMQFFIVLLFSPSLIFAQIIDPNCEPCQYLAGCHPDGTPCPIDTHLYVLLAIGAVYGIKKLRDQRKPADTN